MPPDAIRIADTKTWLGTASKDLRRVGILFAANPPDVEGALFHCQQAVEKAFKAFLTWHDTPFRRVHELDVIGGQCVEVDSTLADLVNRVDALTKYAWRFRYPGAPYEPTIEQGEAAWALARETLDAIVSRLPDSTRQ
jgi:HEPN domain-containing protein